MEKVVAEFNVVGFTSEQYQQVLNDLDAAGKEISAGRINHVAAERPDGLLIIDVWESEEALNKFSETLIPVMKKNGVTPAQPNLYPLHNIIA